MSEKRISLYSTEGGADKAYTLWLEPATGGWTVEAQWGRRGGPMQAGAKTPQPVSREDAEKVYEKTIKEKRAKGYHEGADAPAFSQVKDAVDTGIRPMLLTPDNEESLDKYISDNNWVAQEKKNGKRILLKAGDEVVGINRRGLECPIPEELAKAVQGSWAFFDGELIGSEYHVFDLLAAGHGFKANLRQNTLVNRFGEMCREVNALRSDLVHRVDMVVGTNEKKKFVEKLKADRKEGVVFKRVNGIYLSGKVENLAKSLAVKVKFYAEGSFLVLDWNKGTSSVEVAALDGKKLVSVGNVTIAAKHVEQVRKGDVLRVRYLYATDADQLYQPCADPDDAGCVTAEGSADKLASLKHEGKD